MTSEFEDKFIMPSENEVKRFGGKNGNPMLYVPEPEVSQEKRLGFYGESKIGTAILDAKRILNADFGVEEKKDIKDYDLGI